MTIFCISYNYRKIGVAVKVQMLNSKTQTCVTEYEYVEAEDRLATFAVTVLFPLPLKSGRYFALKLGYA